MLKCEKCNASDDRPVFRTAPKGVTPAGWTCESCLSTPPDTRTAQMVRDLEGTGLIAPSPTRRARPTGEREGEAYGR